MRSTTLINALVLSGTALAVCPYMDGGDSIADYQVLKRSGGIHKRENASADTGEFLAQFEIDDTDVYMTSDVGGPMQDQTSLKAGERGPTLLEDFMVNKDLPHDG
jgi:catalase